MDSVSSRLFPIALYEILSDGCIDLELRYTEFSNLPKITANGRDSCSSPGPLVACWPKSGPGGSAKEE